MQNRVKRLLFEEERARKLESLAKNKADKMLEARDRHQKVIIIHSLRFIKELFEKFRFYDSRIQDMNS